MNFTLLPSSRVLIHSSSGTFVSLSGKIRVCRQYTLFGSSETTPLIFSQLRGFAYFYAFGIHRSAREDGSKAGAPFGSGENTGSSWGIANLRVQKVEVRAPAGDPLQLE